MSEKRLVLLCGLCMVCLWGCGAGERSPGEALPTERGDEEPAFVFRGQVARIAYLREYEGSVIPVGADPNYVLLLESVQPVSGRVPPAEGGRLAFAIHSPARLFMTPPEKVIGAWYEFTARSASSSAGRLVFLEATRVTHD